jgi:1-acyl-sn-glycerol-3-phosphate acyltransferase
VKIVGALQYLFGAIATLIIAPVVIVLSLLNLPGSAFLCVRAWCWGLHAITGVRFTTTGLENVPREEPYVVMSNHCSHLDGPTLIRALPHPVYFVIKTELEKIPLWGYAVVKLGFISVDRSDSARARQKMQTAVEAIRSGRRVVVFAEGTRSRTGELLPFKKGGFHLAIDSGVPILPVAVNHSWRLLPKGTLGARPGRLQVAIGTPIPTRSMEKVNLEDLVLQTRAAIVDLRCTDPDFVPAVDEIKAPGEAPDNLQQ